MSVGESNNKGRHSKFVPEILDILLAALAEHCSIIDACRIAGVSERTYHDWRASSETGEPGTEAFAAFFAAVNRTRAEARRGALKLIQDAGKLDWKAAAWFVERSDPENWAAPSRSKVEVTLAAMTDDDLIAEAEGRTAGSRAAGARAAGVGT